MANEEPSVEDILWEMCDPHIQSTTGIGPVWKKFRLFVHHFLAPYMAMQFEEEAYYREIWEEMWQHKNAVWQMPRGHTKTEMVGIWATIYIAVFEPHNPFFKQYKGKDKMMKEQLLIAGGQDDLNAWTDRIKEFFDKSPRLQKFKPEGARADSTTNSWNKKEMFLRNGHKLHLRTVKSRIRGLHVDRVCADDLITESATLTDQQTIDVWDGAVHGTTTTKEALNNLTGTPMRFTDIQFHLKNKPEGYFFKARPAIVNEQTKEVLSPKRRTYADLMRIKKEIGSTKFSAEYMLNPIDDNISLIKREHLNQCLDPYFEGMWVKPNIFKVGTTTKVKVEKANSFTFRREDWEAVYLSADFAFSDRKTADWSVFSYYGKKNDKVYKLGYVRGQGWTPGTQMAMIKALCDYFNVTAAGLEENSIYGVIKDVRHLNIPAKLFWMGNTDSAAKRKPDTDYSGKKWTISKINAITRLATSYENSKIILPYKTERDKVAIDRQIEESISWATEDGKLVEIGFHPDIPITDILMNEMTMQKSSGIEVANISRATDQESYEDDDKPRIMVKGQAIKGESQY